MIRGTRVGKAYIEVTANGDGINEDIVKSFDDVDGDRIGREIGDDYGKGFNKALAAQIRDSNKEFDDFVNRLPKAIDADKLKMEQIVGDLDRAFKNGDLDKLFEHVGREAGVKMGDGFDNVIKKEVLDSIEKAMIDANRRGGKVDLSSLLTGNKYKQTVNQLGPALINAISRVDREAKRIEGDRLKRAEADIKAEEALRVAAVERFENFRAKLVARRKDDASFLKYSKMAEEHLSKIKISPKLNGKALSDIESKIRDSFEKLDDLNLRLTADLSERERAKVKAQVESIHAVIRVATRVASGKRPGEGNPNDKRLGTRLGGFLGVGARNNALNLFGKSMRGILNVSESVVREGLKIGSSFKTAFSEAEGVVGKFRAGAGAAFTEVGASLSRVLSIIATSGPVAVVAVLGITAALSALVSVVGALLGIVTALVSTIASGLVGALAVAAAGATALVAAGGLLVLAFKSLSVEQKKVLSTSFKPIKDELTGLGQVVAKGLVPYFAKWAKNIEGAIALAQPLASVMGKAFGQAGEALTKSFSGDGVRKFLASLTISLPSITKNLSGALGGFLNGLLGMFAAIMPQVRTFSKYLADVATRFDKWTNSATGQNAVVDFVDRAVVSLKSMWKFLGQVGGLLADIFFAKDAQNAGNGMFDSMAKSINSMRKAVEKAISDGSFQQWLKDASTFGRGLYTTIQGLTALFMALYSSGMVQAMAKVFEGLGNIFKILSPLIRPIANGIGMLLSLKLGVFGAGIQLTVDSIEHLIDIAKSLPGIGKAFGDLNKSAPSDTGGGGIGGFFKGLGGSVLGASVALTEFVPNLGLANVALKGTANGVSRLTGANNKLNASLSASDPATKKWNESLRDLGRYLKAASIPGFAKDLKTLPKSVRIAVTTPGAISSVENLSLLAAKAGLTPKEVKTVVKLLGQEGALGRIIELGRKYGLVPKDVKTIVALLGTDGSMANIKRLQKQYDLTRPEIMTIFRAQTGAALNSITYLQRRIDGLHGKVVNIEVRQHRAPRAPTSVLAPGAQLGGSAPRMASGNRGPAFRMVSGNTGPSRGSIFSLAGRVSGSPGAGANQGSAQQLIKSGHAVNVANAAAAAAIKKSGNKANKAVKDATKKWKNPYVKWAKSLIKNGPSIATQIRNAFASVGRATDKAIKAAPSAKTVSDLRSGLSTAMANLISTGKDSVSTAQGALNSAAQSLASATSQKAANKAIKRIRLQQKNVREALANQKRLQKVAAMLKAQKSVSVNGQDAADLISGINLAKTTPAQLQAQIGSISKLLSKSNVTLADFALARRRVAGKIEVANQILQNAIALRDDYKTQIADSIKSFGDLTAVQAKAINGVTQALSANDVIGNLQAKLTQIKNFQSNLNILLSEGLSDAAYKQLLDAGPEQGGAVASALVTGGQGAITQVNALTGQIGSAADALGTAAADRLYQAGVDAAQGLVNGLNSLSDEIDSAATKLGSTIAKAIAKALGIHSPSRVLIDMMEHVGNGTVIGLDNQTVKVSAAAAALSDKIAISPEAAAYSAQKRAAVSGSGSGQVFRDLIVHTPTKDPKAVAKEAVSEMVGRI